MHFSDNIFIDSKQTYKDVVKSLTNATGEELTVTSGGFLGRSPVNGADKRSSSNKESKLFAFLKLASLGKKKGWLDKLLESSLKKIFKNLTGIGFSNKQRPKDKAEASAHKIFKKGLKTPSSKRVGFAVEQFYIEFHEKLIQQGLVADQKKEGDFLVERVKQYYKLNPRPSKHNPFFSRVQKVLRHFDNVDNQEASTTVNKLYGEFAGPETEK